MTIYQALTTCNASQWTQYGRAMATTFCRHWPTDVPLRVYAEGFTGDQNGRVEFVDLDAAAPWLAPWKAQRSRADRGKSKGRYHFKRDAVRFSHKIAAIGAAADRSCNREGSCYSCKDIGYCPGDIEPMVLIWLDADTVTHSSVTVGWLEELFPPEADMAWLDRAQTYPECGFLMFRLPSSLGVISDIVAAYQTGAIFKFLETHDSFVIQQIVNSAVGDGEVIVASLSGDGRQSHHPFAVGPLGSRMDHLKGSRKTEGRSRPADFPHPRPEPYWR